MEEEFMRQIKCPDCNETCIKHGVLKSSSQRWFCKHCKVAFTVKINNLSIVSGYIGAFNMGGYTLGSGANGNLNANISVKEIIIKRIATDESDTIFNYFKNKHNVQY